MQKIPLYPNDHRKLILMIDDDRRLLDRIQDFFPHYHFRCFDDCDQILLAIKTYYPGVSLVILDLEIFIKNRLHFLVPNLPVLVWAQDESQVENVQKLGATAFICKPVDLAVLGQMIDRILNP